MFFKQILISMQLQSKKFQVPSIFLAVGNITLVLSGGEILSEGIYQNTLPKVKGFKEDCKMERRRGDMKNAYMSIVNQYFEYFERNSKQ